MQLVRKVVPTVPFFPLAWDHVETRAIADWVMGRQRGQARTWLEEPLDRLYPGKQFALYNCGKTALFQILKDLAIGPGDEVLVPAYVCDSVFFPILKLGATPVEVDVDEGDLNVSVSSVRAHISDRTKAIVVPHLYGNPADIEAIASVAAQHKIAVIDDAAQSFGAKIGCRFIGGFGKAGFFSIGPGKSTSGLCGAVALTDRELPGLPNLLSKRSVARDYSKFLVTRRFRRFFYPVLRLVSRRSEAPAPFRNQDFPMSGMGPLDACIARSQIDKVLNGLVERRKNNFQYLKDLVGSDRRLQVVTCQRGESAFVKFVFVLKLGDPGKLFKRLQAAGVEVYPAYAAGPRFGRREDFLADKVAARVFEFPTNLTERQTATLGKIILESLETA